MQQDDGVTEDEAGYRYEIPVEDYIKRRDKCNQEADFKIKNSRGYTMKILTIIPSDELDRFVMQSFNPKVDIILMVVLRVPDLVLTKMMNQGTGKIYMQIESMISLEAESEVRTSAKAIRKLLGIIWGGNGIVKRHCSEEDLRTDDEWDEWMETRHVMGFDDPGTSRTCAVFALRRRVPDDVSYNRVKRKRPYQVKISDKKVDEYEDNRVNCEIQGMKRIKTGVQ